MFLIRRRWHLITAELMMIIIYLQVWSCANIVTSPAVMQGPIADPQILIMLRTFLLPSFNLVLFYFLFKKSTISID